jgi:hypothetical protein
MISAIYEPSRPVYPTEEEAAGLAEFEYQQHLKELHPYDLVEVRANELAHDEWYHPQSVAFDRAHRESLEIVLTMALDLARKQAKRSGETVRRPSSTDYNQTDAAMDRDIYQRLSDLWNVHYQR